MWGLPAGFSRTRETRASLKESIAETKSRAEGPNSSRSRPTGRGSGRRSRRRLSPPAPRPGALTPPPVTGLTLARRGPVEAHDAVDPLLRVHQQLPPPQLGSALRGREASGGPRGRGRRSRPATVLHPRRKRPRRYLSAAQWGRPASVRRR